MKSLYLLGGMLLGLLMVASPHRAAAQDSRILDYMEKDPQVNTYVDLGRRGNAFRVQWKHAIPKQIAKECNTTYGYTGCQVGWDAFAGRPMAGVADFIAASVAVGKWDQAGTKWNYKFQYMLSFSGQYSMDGLVLFNVPNGAALAAATIDSPQKLKELSSGSHEYAYRTLWYLGATSFADVMIRGLGTTYGRPLHRDIALHVMNHWKLTGPQLEAIEKLCVNDVFQGASDEAKHAVPACARFLGFAQTRNADAKEFLVNLTGDRNNGRHAVRALGLLGHKGAKPQLLKCFGEGHRKSTVDVRQGRKLVRKVMDTWYPSQNVAPAAVALLGLGDPKAKAAIAHWMTFDAVSKKLAEPDGWEELSFELPFASPKAYKAIRGPFLKTYQQLQKAAETESGLRRYSLASTIGLAQAGETAVLKSLLAALRSTDQNEVQKVLKGIGGDIERMYDNQQTGRVGILVGKGGFSVAQAKQIASEIRRRFKFWTDEATKRFAIHATLDIEARIKAQAP